MDTFADAMPRRDHDDDLAGMLASVAAGGNRPLAQAETLPPAAYTSEAFFAREVETIFKPGWVCVGHVSQVAEPGAYFTLDLFDEMLVVVRGRDGEVRVLSRVCPHRWAPVVSGAGRLDKFSCPFHKWGFALDGALLGAPLMDEVEFDPQGCGLTGFRTAVANGFIFVNLTGDATPLDALLAGFDDRLGKFRLEELVVVGEYAYDCQFNWKIMVETFMECYHHIAAHPETFEKAFPARQSYIDDSAEGWTWGGSLSRDTVPEADLRLGVPLLTDDLTTDDRRSFYLYLVYPSHLLAVWADRIYWFRAQPVSAARTALQTYVLMRPEARDLPGFDELMAHEMAFLDQVNQEDIAVNTMQQRGAGTGAARAGRLSHLEKAIWQLADYVRARVA